MDATPSRGDRLVAPGAIAKEIDAAGRVKFVHEALPQGVMWVEAHHRPGGVERDEALDLWFIWTPSASWYRARRRKEP